MLCAEGTAPLSKTLERHVKCELNILKNTSSFSIRQQLIFKLGWGNKNLDN